MSATGEPTNEMPRRLGANYRKLFTASMCSNLGDGLMSVAVVWLASSLTRDATLIALVALMTRLPWLLFALPAGVIADRYDRRHLVAGMDVAEIREGLRWLWRNRLLRSLAILLGAMNLLATDQPGLARGARSWPHPLTSTVKPNQTRRRHRRSLS